jgi:predicted DNA-binding transcriptional regulator AlpA
MPKMTEVGFLSLLAFLPGLPDPRRTRVPTPTPIHRAHLTITDLCAELGVARSTFYDWRAARKAPRCIKLPNGEIRIRRADFEKWLVSLEDAA